MNCLDEYIGLDTDSGECESGLYVTELPGISTGNLEKISNPDGNAFKDCRKRAVQSFLNSFLVAMNDCWRLRDAKLAEDLICENKGILGVSLWYFVGAEIMLERQSSDRVNRFTTLSLKKIAELETYFRDKADFELREAVKLIDPNISEDNPVECAALITTVPPVI